MKLIQDNGHNDMCGGYSYNYKVVWGKYGTTVKDVLREIKEYTNSHSEFGKLEDYGYQQESKTNYYWGIYINDNIYLSKWSGENDRSKNHPYKKFYAGDETEEVIDVVGDGGWYCAVNFNIITK